MFHWTKIITCKVSSAHHYHLWSSLRCWSSTAQTPTRRASLPAFQAQELELQNCFQKRRTLGQTCWGPPLYTGPQSVCHTCCSSHPGQVTEDTQVSLFRLKVQISIRLLCHNTWMLIKAYQMDVWLSKTWTEIICFILSMLMFWTSTYKPCWVLFLHHVVYLRERHDWGHFSGQHIWVWKREI